MPKPKHERTVEIQKSLETRLRFPISYFDSRRYIQHNLMLEDGLGPILALMDALPADRTRVEALRSFEDGDHSVAHLDYVLGDWGPMVGFEVHRWEDDRIVEHWNNLQAKPATANVSGRSMIDGVSQVNDLARSDVNKTLVRDYTQDILVERDLSRAGTYFDGDVLIQLSPLLGDGLTPLHEMLSSARRGGPGPTYARLHKVLGQGDMVLAISEGSTFDGTSETSPAAYYDLYRFEDGVIAEHWDVMEVIPPREAWKNDNGKF